MPVLPLLEPTSDRDRTVRWVADHLGDLSGDVPHASSVRGGQAAADGALATLDLTGYARRRSQVLPVSSRGASRLSPYVRHGLLTLPQVWDAAADAPPADRTKYRDELLWQEYARHLYARLGPQPRDLPAHRAARHRQAGDPWPREMACMDLALDELEGDGWVVNQVRMWLASQWTVRGGRAWQEGEDLHVPAPARRLAGGEPARLAVDDRRRLGQAVRLLPLAGREARAGAVPRLPAAARLPGAGLARQHRRARGSSRPPGSPAARPTRGPRRRSSPASRRRCG